MKPHIGSEVNLLSSIIMNKSVQKIVLVVLRKTMPFIKKEANIVVVNIINQSFIL